MASLLPRNSQLISDSPKKSKFYSLKLRGVDPLRSYFFNNATPSTIQKGIATRSAQNLQSPKTNKVHGYHQHNVDYCINHKWGKHFAWFLLFLVLNEESSQFLFSFYFIQLKFALTVTSRHHATKKSRHRTKTRPIKALSYLSAAMKTKCMVRDHSEK